MSIRNRTNIQKLEELRGIIIQEIQDAKHSKNYQKLHELSPQMWMINDLISGIKTNKSDEELAETTHQ